MRFGKTLIGAALGLGLTALTPAFTQAADRHFDRHGDRDGRRFIHQDVHVREVRRAPERVIVDRPRVNVVVPAPVAVYTPDFDQVVSVQSVPGAVLDTCYRNGDGLPISRINYVRQAGQTYYEFTMARHGSPLMVRVGLDGSFLGCE